jgi:hypothetical protein
MRLVSPSTALMKTFTIQKYGEYQNMSKRGLLITTILMFNPVIRCWHRVEVIVLPTSSKKQAASSAGLMKHESSSEV